MCRHLKYSRCIHSTLLRGRAKLRRMEAHNGNSPVRHYRLKPQILAIICTETPMVGKKAGENKEAGRNRALRRKISYKKYYEKYAHSLSWSFLYTKYSLTSARNKDMLREKARERAARYQHLKWPRYVHSMIMIQCIAGQNFAAWKSRHQSKLRRESSVFCRPLLAIEPSLRFESNKHARCMHDSWSAPCERARWNWQAEKYYTIHLWVVSNICRRTLDILNFTRE